jgi:hypothetical protein
MASCSQHKLELGTIFSGSDGIASDRLNFELGPITPVSLSCTKHYLRTVEYNGKGHPMRLSARNPGCCSPCPPNFLHGRPPLNAFTELYPLADLFPALSN